MDSCFNTNVFKKIAKSTSLMAQRRIQVPAQFLKAQAKLLLVVFAAAFVPPQALAITRIGNSKFGSNELGFQASISKPFVFLRQIENDGALLISVGDGILRDGEPLVVKPLSAALSGVEALDRGEFRELFEANKPQDEFFVNLHPFDPCIEAYSGPWTSQESTHVGIASWGQGRGIMIYGSNGKVVRAAIRDILKNLEVNEGACGWK